MSKAPKRLYEVKDSTMLDSHPSRLIEADSQGSVRSHIQKPFVISVPDPMRVLDLVNNKGVKVERAGADKDAEAAANRG